MHILLPLYFQTARNLRIRLECEHSIDEDNKIGVVAEFHDETHLNSYLAKTNIPITELNPSYCMTESIAKRRYHRIEHLPAKILALEKDFNYFRG